MQKRILIGYKGREFHDHSLKATLARNSRGYVILRGPFKAESRLAKKIREILERDEGWTHPHVITSCHSCSYGNFTDMDRAIKSLKKHHRKIIIEE